MPLPIGASILTPSVLELGVPRVLFRKRSLGIAWGTQTETAGCE